MSIIQLFQNNNDLIMFHIFLKTYICQARFKCFTHVTRFNTVLLSPRAYYLGHSFLFLLDKLPCLGLSFSTCLKKEADNTALCVYDVQVNTRRDYIENDILVRVNWQINGSNSCLPFFKELPDCFAKCKTAAPFYILTMSA